MLKFIFLKNQKIPVPIPLLNLREALFWVEDNFCKKHEIITKITLNGEEIEFDDENRFDRINLSDTCKLSFQLDEPKDLSVQTLEALKNLALVILPRVKLISVDLYDSHHDHTVNAFDEAMEDMRYIFDLRHHINGVLDCRHRMLAPFVGLAHLAKIVSEDLARLRAAKKWSQISVALVGRLEPFLKDLVKEIDTLQIEINADDSLILNSVHS